PAAPPVPPLRHDQSASTNASPSSTCITGGVSEPHSAGAPEQPAALPPLPPVPRVPLPALPLEPLLPPPPSSLHHPRAVRPNVAHTTATISELRKAASFAAVGCITSPGTLRAAISPPCAEQARAEQADRDRPSGVRSRRAGRRRAAAFVFDPAALF